MCVCVKYSVVFYVSKTYYIYTQAHKRIIYNEICVHTHVRAKSIYINLRELPTSSPIHMTLAFPQPSKLRRSLCSEGWH